MTTKLVKYGKTFLHGGQSVMKLMVDINNRARKVADS